MFIEEKKLLSIASFLDERQYVWYEDFEDFLKDIDAFQKCYSLMISNYKIFILNKADFTEITDSTLPNIFSKVNSTKDPKTLIRILSGDGFSSKKINLILKSKKQFELNDNNFVTEELNNLENRLNQNYLTQISKQKLLTLEEEQTLIADKKNPVSRNELVERNLRWVVNLAKKYINRGLSLQDLIQEGNIGLMKAADRFENSFNTRFTTYAYCWIIQSIMRAISDKATIVRIPVHLTEMLTKINKFISIFSRKTGREPTNKEILEEFDILTLKKLNTLKNLKKVSLNLDQTTNGDSDSKSIVEFISDQKDILMNSIVMDESKDHIEKIIKKLPPRQLSIIKLRYEVKGNKIKKRNITLDQIGKKIDLTRERTRQLEKEALEFIYKEYKKLDLCTDFIGL